MADYTAYFCGDFVPFSQVRIDPLDRGFLVGDCVFDVARTFSGKSFRMREHVDRLYRSLAYVRIDPGLSPDEMERISEEVYDLYTADEAFFTSTSPCVLPVTQVERRPIAGGKPGPVVARR